MQSEFEPATNQSYLQVQRSTGLVTNPQETRKGEVQERQNTSPMCQCAANRKDKTHDSIVLFNKCFTPSDQLIL